MEEGSICAPLLAESDTENNIISTHNVASVSDADTVINTNNTNSSQIEDLGESDLLKGLFTDSHCHVCEASLLFESQRIAHYEGKKHAQKVRLYVQTKKDEKRSKDFQRGITMDKDRFCELCSMVFSSPVVARSHYDGKVHAKNLRKQALYPTTQPADTLSQRVPGLAIPGPLQVSGIDQGMGEEGGKGPQNTSETVDLSDPNKHCRLCAASFNNPHMAQQHYAGRKHQRNHSRQQLLKDLGEDPAQANSFTCPVCNIKLDSVEMYHAHMQGNKHQIKEKKVVDLCKSQKKVYDSFADELADYIHVQKARGIAPKTSFGATEEEGEGGANLGKVDSQNKTTLGLPPSSCPPLPLTSLPLHPTAAFYPPPLWCPPYQAPPTHFGFKGGTYEQTAWGHTFPQPFIPGSAPAGFIGWPKARGRGKECSSSSSSCTSSSSSYSSSSDSSDSDYRHRERKRRKRKMRKERERRAREEDSEERKRRRRGKSLREDDTEGRRGREHDEEAEEESRRKRKRLHYSSRSHREGHRAKKRREEDEEKEGRKEEKEESTEERVGGGEEKEVHIQAEIQEEMDDREQAKETKAKHRKDKKKTKEKVDTRTEEEKLWDESIIGL